MRKYRLECLDPVVGDGFLVGSFETRCEARQALRSELRRWRDLAEGPDFRHDVGQHGRDRFVVRTPSGQTILYQIAAASRRRQNGAMDAV